MEEKELAQVAYGRTENNGKGLVSGRNVSE
jgi:hypothetical protein